MIVVALKLDQGHSNIIIPYGYPNNVYVLAWSKPGHF